MESAAVAIRRWVDAEGLSALVSREVAENTAEASMLIGA